MSDVRDKSSPGLRPEEKLDSKVIPVMREAVAMVQMIVYRELREKLTEKYIGWRPGEYRRLVGCIVNDIFGAPALGTDSVDFAPQHREVVEEELRALAGNVPDILPHLTDALRMQTLCDHEEGTNTLPTLLRARALGILQEDRPIPMPSTFMILVRQLGAKHGLVEPAAEPQE